MFMSLLVLNPRSRAVRRDLSDCRGLHRTLLNAFPSTNIESGQGGGARLEFGLLYRAESDPRTGRIQVLIQSRHQPDWSCLPNDYLSDDFTTIDNPAMKRIDQSYQSLSAGQRLRFRLRANPTRRISDKCTTENSGGKGKRVEIHQPEKQVEWLKRKGEQHGFKLISLNTSPGVPNLIARTEDKTVGSRGANNPSMIFGSVTFEGVLEISDLERFTAALGDGIGSGKAFGFGLLSIAPIQQPKEQEE